MNNSNDFKKLVHRDASEYRSKKVKEFFEIPKEQRSDFNESIIKLWIEKYGKRF